MNLRDKIQALYTSTTSAEVKSLCESFLQNKDAGKLAETKLLESLNVVRSADANVNTLLTEQENLQKSINGIESQISQNAAQKLMEGWGGIGSNKTSNVGNHVNKVLIREKAKEVENEKILMEGLKAISDTDASANSMLKSLETGSYGVSESIDALRSSSIAKHPQFKYILEKFDGYITGNISESKIVKDYVSNLSAYTWDKSVNESYTKVKTLLESKAAEVEVQNAIFDIRSTDTKGFFSSVVEKLSTWVNNEKRNIPSLIKEMKSYQFNSIVKDLTNKLLLMENTRGTHFNIPVNSSNCEISNIYSPVILKGGNQIFKAGPNFYAATKGGVHKLTEAQINALPQSYLELCEAFFNPAVKVANDDIVMYVGKSKVTIGDTIKVNEQVVTVDNLGSTLMTYSQGSIFGSISPLVNVAVRLAENVNNVVEINFGKAIFSSLYEGVGVYMFRRADKVFMNKLNPSMNENRFFEANGLQAVKFVKNFLSYNVSESLSDLLTGDAAKKIEMEKALSTVMSNINLLESELNKIESAIVSTPEIADSTEVIAAKELVETELNSAKSAWQELNTEIKKFENADEEVEGEPTEIVDVEVEYKSDNTPPNDGDDDGGLPVTDPIPDSDPVTPATVADSTGDVVNVGVAGAEGAQTQTTEIQGNDHIDANATTDPGTAAANGETALPSDNVVAAGFAGAEGTQQVNTAEQNLADVSVVPATSSTAEITIPANLEPVAQDTQATTLPPAADVATTNTGINPNDTVNAADPAASAIVDPANGDKGEEKSNEALDTNVQVKLKGSDKIGKITASNSTEHTFTVMWDDGETGDYSEDALEEIKPESADNQANNVAAAAKITKEVVEGEQTPAATEDPENIDVYVKGTITIDFGPYKEGEQLEINAADYTAAGDDDPIKVKEPKEEIGTIPKKYVKVEDGAPKEEMSEVQSKLDNIVKNLEEIGTFIKGNDKMDSKSLEEALEKIKAYSSAISKESK